MKKEYNAPVVRLSRFSRENIITASGNSEAYDRLINEKNVNANNITIIDELLVF